MLLNKIYVSFIVGRPTRLNKKPYRLKTCLLLVAFVSAYAPTAGARPGAALADAGLGKRGR